MRRALRRRPADAGGVEVVVTGMGQQAAAAAAARDVPGAAAVVVCGLAGGCGGLAHRGDVVVASRLIDASGTALAGVVPVEVAGVLAGTVASIERPVDAAEDRAVLLAQGAVAVETEAAAWAHACAAAEVPLAVVRGVLDTPEHPLGGAAGLVRPGGRGPALTTLLPVLARPRSWPDLVRLGRSAAPVERRAAAAAVRVAAALRAG